MIKIKMSQADRLALSSRVKAEYREELARAEAGRVKFTKRTKVDLCAGFDDAVAWMMRELTEVE